MLTPKRKPAVLFVDDDRLYHTSSRRIAKALNLRPRFALSPQQAKQIIAKRVAAIERLQKQKAAKLKTTANTMQRRVLQQQLHALEQMKKSPFDLIVSDINMPRGNPTGVGFARDLKKNFSKQKLLIHSDDVGAMDLLSREDKIPSSTKLDFYSEAKLKGAIRRMLPRTQ